MKMLMSIIVVFSLLFAPLAHATESACEGGQCESTQLSKQDLADTNDADGAQDGHHCCVSHVALRLDIAPAQPVVTFSRTFFVPTDESLVSIVNGPALQPPSHI